jgi:RimJ/RimL family protein N-acetyltransferase
MEPGCPDFDVTLRDGRVVHIRSARPADEAEMLQAFNRLSKDARYMRFMRYVNEPDRARMRAVLASFPDGGGSVVATIPAADGIDIVGGATYLVGNDRSSCEFAITVGAEYCGVGLARILMTSLIGVARAHGIREMDGFVLAVNQPMLRLARRLGFTVTPDPEDGTVRICRLRLGND